MQILLVVYLFSEAVLDCNSGTAAWEISARKQVWKYFSWMEVSTISIENDCRKKSEKRQVVLTQQHLSGIVDRDGAELICCWNTFILPMGNQCGFHSIFFHIHCLNFSCYATTTTRLVTLRAIWCWLFPVFRCLNRLFPENVLYRIQSRIMSPNGEKLNVNQKKLVL